MKKPSVLISALFLILGSAGIWYAVTAIYSEQVLENSSSQLLLDVTQEITLSGSPDSVNRHGHESWLEDGQEAFLTGFSRYQPTLGALVSVQRLSGEMQLTSLLRLRSQSTASYVLLGSFEGGTGRVTAELIWENGRWQIREYFLYSLGQAS